MAAGSRFQDAVVLVVHAHPDDEVFATGAATLAAEAAGATVHLRIFTGGEGRGVGASGDRLSAARSRKEARLRASTRLLGIADWAYLAEPGRWTDTPDRPEQTIAAAPLSDLVASVAHAIDALRPDVVLTVGEEGLTGHPDHIACHKAVLGALSAASHQPREVLGAVLDSRSVTAGSAQAAATWGRPVGSGRVTGTRVAEPVMVQGPTGSAGRRRRALDEYVPGLGTADAADVRVTALGAGDSVLLRFVLDISGWDCDRFVPLEGT